MFLDRGFDAFPQENKNLESSTIRYLTYSNADEGREDRKEHEVQNEELYGEEDEKYMNN